MFASHQKSIAIVSLLVISGGVLGCASGRLGDQWENPFRSVDTSYKESYGQTPSDVAEEIRGLAEKVATMPVEEQQKVALELAARYKTEKDPNLRRELVYALGAFPDPYATAGLHAAMADTDRFVRAEACRAWGRRSSEEAMQTLAAAIHTEDSVDVRQAAIRAIKRFQHPDAIRALGGVLDERDPALQFLAMQSLKNAAGKDLGNDTRKWNEFIASNYPLPSGDPTSPSPADEIVAETPDASSWR